jgi:hypothetical protein
LTLAWDDRVLCVTAQVLYLVAFYSMLRASNLLPASHAEADPDRQLTWSRIRRFTGGAVFRIVQAKNLQFSEHVHEVSLPEKKGSMFCPISALAHLAKLRGGQFCGLDDFVFMASHNGQWTTLLKAPVVKLFRLQLGRMGLDPSKYGFHSFRRGAIQAAVRCQPSLELVRLQSGHTSSAVHVYTAMPGAARMVTGAKMLAELAGVAPVSLAMSPPFSPPT